MPSSLPSSPSPLSPADSQSCWPSAWHTMASTASSICRPSSPSSSPSSPTASSSLLHGSSFPQDSEEDPRPRPASFCMSPEIILVASGHPFSTSPLPHRSSFPSAAPSSFDYPTPLPAPSVYRRGERAALRRRQGRPAPHGEQQTVMSREARRVRELRNRQVGLELHHEAAMMHGGEQRDFDDLTM